MTRTAADDFWLLEQAEWLFDEITYRTHMRARNRIMLACLPPALVGAWTAWQATAGPAGQDLLQRLPAMGEVAGLSPLALTLTMAYVWVVWTILYEREVARFLPAKAACYLVLVLPQGEPVPDGAGAG